jgi:hypothetical protein
MAKWVKWRGGERREGGGQWKIGDENIPPHSPHSPHKVPSKIQSIIIPKSLQIIQENKRSKKWRGKNNDELEGMGKGNGMEMQSPNPNALANCYAMKWPHHILKKQSILDKLKPNHKLILNPGCFIEKSEMP